MGRLAPVYGIVLLAGLIAVYLLPGILAPILVCLMPVTSGLLLNLSWRKSQSVSFPPILTRNTTRHATLSIVIVCLISFIVAYVSYFVVAIVPWEDLWGVERSFTFGVGIGAILILVIGLAHARLQGKTTIFKLFPWILLFSLVACLLCLSSYPEDFTGFLLALTASSVLEVLVIMYMARLTLSGYTPSATAFGMSAAAIRFGILLGNGTALIYERIPGFQDLWTQPTLLVFVVVLAGLLIPLVRQEYSINDLTVAPVDASQWSTTLEGISKQFHLSARETEILELLGRGYTATAVAEKLIISPHTVNTHVQHIYEKMGIHRRSELLDYLNKG
jgi:DNA-binding CsgD family transcriptional regulator